jgi:hypothetical protein
MFFAPIAVFEAVAAMIATSSRSLHVVPPSVERKTLPTIALFAAAVACADMNVMVSIRVPSAAPVASVVIVPLPSRAVLAALKAAKSTRGSSMKIGLVFLAMLLYEIIE